MKIPNIFELKQKSNYSGGLYPYIVRIHGKNTPQYSDAKYRIIAKEGYAENYAIFRCLTEITQAAIQLKWGIYTKDKDGKKQLIPNHPIQAILDKPNPSYSQAEFLRRAIIFYYLGGDAPIIKIGVNHGKEIKEIYVHRPDKISIGLTGDVKAPYSEVRYEGRNPQDFRPDQLTLWKHFNPLDEFDGAGRGMSPLKPILKNGDLLNAMLDWNVSLMQNGGQVSGVISVPDGFDNEAQRKRNEVEIKNKYTGTRNVGRWMLLEKGATASLTGTNPKDMDWINGKESTIKDICIGIGVDPIIIGLNKESTYNNKKEAEKGLYTKTVIPLLQSLAGQLTTFLNLGDNEVIDVDYSEIPVLQEDIKELNDKLNNGDLTINEKRKARGQKEIPGGDVIVQGNYAIANGKVYIPANLIPMEDEEPQEQTTNNSSSGSEKPNNSDNENKSFMY